jgi:uncharacterized protein
VAIRASISSTACREIEDFVEFLCSGFRCRHLHLEPIASIESFTGVRVEDVRDSEADLFVDAFRRARVVAAKYGVEVYYSGSKVQVRDSFCGATRGKTFMITSGRAVTSCNEVLYEKDKRRAIFHYGSWSEETGFQIDEKRLATLATLNGDSISKCQGCFAKFTCAGDCYAKTAALYGQPWNTPYTVRCNINRELLRDELLLKLLSSAATVASKAPELRLNA